MAERVLTYAAALVVDWFAERTGRAYSLDAIVDGDVPVFVANSDAGKLAVAIAPLWERESDAAAEDARQAMEERLDAGNVRGPFLIWAPPRAAVPGAEPEASDFVMRAQMACAPMQPGARNEIRPAGQDPARQGARRRRLRVGHWRAQPRLDSSYRARERHVPRKQHADAARAAI